jgi:hypothetical protein
VTPEAATVAVVDALDAAGVPYMIVGSLASNFYGIPRATADADLIVELTSAALDRFRRALPPELQLQSQGAFETVTGSVRYAIELQGSPFIFELFARTDDPHDRERFDRRRAVRILDRTMYVASAEDMIVTKLRWATDARRLKDRDDVRNMLGVIAADLDWAYLRRWTETHGTTGLLDEIRRSIRARDAD